MPLYRSVFPQKAVLEAEILPKGGSKMLSTTNFRIRLVILLFLVVFVASGAAGKIIYVDVNAAGANNGSSWADSYTCLQDALADANSTAKPVEICVAQGNYKPDQGANQTPGEREATFRLVSGVTLTGGYAGLGVFDVNDVAIDPNTRHIDAFKTILSGDLNGDDVEVNEPGNLSTDPNRAENCYHVVTGSGTDPNAVLDGFEITGGMADKFWFTVFAGAGGVRNDYGSPTFRNCRFVQNIGNDGGAVCNLSASPVFINCIFTGNEAVPITITKNNEEDPIIAAASGGGVDNFGSSNPVFINCAFWENRAEYGGAIDVWENSSSTLYNCTLSGNVADFGGAIYNCSYSPATTTIINSVLWGNEARNEDEILNCGSRSSTTIVSYTCIDGGYPGTGNIDRDPRFVSGPLGDYYLSQTAAGQTKESPCVDAGSDTASNLEMNRFTTRTDEVGDQDIVDMGYHYPKSPPLYLIIDEGFETGDFSRFNWVFSGNVNWTVTSGQMNSGNYSAKAGSISDDEYTTLEITLDCVSGDISFYCKVSSESGYDYLNFHIDNEEKGKWSGEQEWEQVSFPVTAGTRTFTWTYSKDGSSSRGSDTAWLDDIVFPVF